MHGTIDAQYLIPRPLFHPDPMEATANDLGEILSDLTLRPPRLEDAGLEDCALPPESIMEAFTRAAGAFKSRLIPSDGDGGCVQDPGPSNGSIPDAVIVSGGEIPSKPFCAGEGEMADSDGGGRDEVVVVGGGEAEGSGDRVVVLGGDGAEGGGKSCVVDGEEKDEDCNDGVDGEDEGDEKPRLVEGLI